MSDNGESIDDKAPAEDESAMDEPVRPATRIVIGGPPIAPGPMTPYIVGGDKPRRPWKVVALVGGCAALLVAIVFAVAALAGGDERTGASSPDEAVRRLVAAANDGDVAAMVDTLLPSEQRVWGAPLLEVLAQAERLEVLASDAEMDLQLDVSVGAPEQVATDIAVVPLAGTASFAATAGDTPLGALLAELGLAAEATSAGGRTSAPVDARLAAVERDGRWFVSLGYSVAEAERVDREDPPPWPSAARGLQPVGAADPAGAVRELLAAIEDRSLERVIGAINPQEAEVLQRVAPWYLDETQDRLDDVLDQAAFTFDVEDTELTVSELDGDRAQVEIDGLGLAAEVAGAKIRYHDGCLATTPPGGQEASRCLGNEGEPDGKVVVRKVDGEWYVSPVGSGSTVLLDAVRSLDQSRLDTIVGDIGGVLDLLEGLLGATFQDELSDPSNDGTSDVATDDGGSSSEQPIDRYLDCQGRAGYDGALKCVTDGLASGAFARDLVDGIYLAPECGWVGYRYDPTLFALADAAYVAKAALSAACFDARIAAGVIAENQRPLELTRVECLNGKNPATMTARESLAYTTCRRG